MPKLLPKIWLPKLVKLATPAVDCTSEEASKFGFLLCMGWTVRGSNHGGSEIFRTRPDRPWGPPMGAMSVPGVKRVGRGIDHLPPSSAEVKERGDIATPLLGLRGLF